MTKWEYLILDVLDRNIELNTALEDAGNAGWELVSRTNCGSTVVATPTYGHVPVDQVQLIFKRPKD